VIGQPLQLETIVIETGSGPVPVRLEREGPKIVFGRMEQPIPSIEPFDEAPLLAALGIERSELPSSSTTTGCGTSTSRSGARTRSSRSSPT
jgi:predicted PhzF superfamily epimerase YddE/YHI9